MRYLIYFVLSLIALGLFNGKAAHSQSFQCTSTSTLVDQFICLNKPLANLDLQLASAYRTVLAEHPEAKVAVVANQRRWLKPLGHCAQESQGGGAIVDCLKEVYSQRVLSIGAPNFVGDAIKAMAPTELCQKLLERYKPLAHAHPGEWPTALLVKSATSGLTMDSSPVLSMMDAVAELQNYGAAQRPPFSLSAELNDTLKNDQDMGNGGGRLTKAPNLNFYQLARTQGSMGCDSSLYFFVRNGVAVPSELPIPSDESACGSEGGDFATLDGTPIFLGTSFSGRPGLTAGFKMSTWRNEDFQQACQIDLAFRPWFSDRTYNNWGSACEGGHCETLHRAAFRLAERSFQYFERFKSAELARLTESQRAQFDEAEKLASEARDEAANMGSGQLPYVRDGHLYVVSIGNFTIGWRVYSDLQVKFQSLKEGSLVTDAIFAVGVWKGDVESASVTPALIDP